MSTHLTQEVMLEELQRRNFSEGYDPWLYLAGRRAVSHVHFGKSPDQARARIVSGSWQAHLLRGTEAGGRHCGEPALPLMRFLFRRAR